MIRTRDQLLDKLAEWCKRRAIRRALEEGTVEVCGGFNTDPPCWIVKVTSAHGAVWAVGVQPNGMVRILEFIPWRLWAGGESPLYKGDNPKKYQRLKEV